VVKPTATERIPAVTDHDAERARLAAVQAELASIEVEARKLLEACAVYLNALARAADDTDDADPLPRDIADRITALLDRRRLAEAEVWELAAEMREQGMNLPAS
jgi:hypothetical protein